MQDYYLKFESEEAAKAALLKAGYKQDEGGNVYHEECATDWIGTITKQVGGTEEEPLFEVVDGYHVNVRTWGEVDFAPEYKVYPTTHMRVWA